MTEPGVAADAQYTVQAVQDNAERLGLIGSASGPP